MILLIVLLFEHDMRMIQIMWTTWYEKLINNGSYIVDLICLFTRSVSGRLRQLKITVYSWTNLILMFNMCVIMQLVMDLTFWIFLIIKMKKKVIYWVFVEMMDLNSYYRHKIDFFYVLFQIIILIRKASRWELKFGVSIYFYICFKYLNLVLNPFNL